MNKIKMSGYAFLIIFCLMAADNSCHFKLELPERGLCAHRGARATHPENTLAAFREAIRLGAHMIEFDVQMTKDSVLVLMHDETVDRTTNGQGAVADLTFAEIRRLDAGLWKDALFEGEKVPTFAEALKIMPKNIWLNIHVKQGAEIGKKVAEQIIKEKRLHQAVIACRNDVAAAVLQISDQIKICNMERHSSQWRYVAETISQHADFIQLNKQADSLLIDLTKQLKANHIKINYYSTNSPDKLKKLFEAGVEFPLVDDLEAMMSVAEKLGIKPLKPIY